MLKIPIDKCLPASHRDPYFLLVFVVQMLNLVLQFCDSLVQLICSNEIFQHGANSLFRTFCDRNLLNLFFITEFYTS